MNGLGKQYYPISINQANKLKTLAKESEMTSRAQTALKRGRIHLENLTFSALLCKKNAKRKRASDGGTKNQEHRNIAPLSLQLRSYKDTHVYNNCFEFRSGAINQSILIIWYATCFFCK